MTTANRESEVPLSVDYPGSAVFIHIQGDNVVRFVVKPDGSTSDIRMVMRTYVMLQDAVKDAVARWKFKPLPDGVKPVDFHDVRRISFTLSNDAAHAPHVSITPSCTLRMPYLGPTPPHPLGVHKSYYPRDAIRAREQGRVLVSFIVNKNGSTADPRVEESSGFPLLDEAASDSVLTWQYTPISEPVRWKAYVVFDMVPGSCEPASLGGIVRALLSGIPLCN